MGSQQLHQRVKRVDGEPEARGGSHACGAQSDGMSQVAKMLGSRVGSRHLRTVRPASARGVEFQGLGQVYAGGAASELVVQMKMKMGAAGDKYEREADRVAAAVVARIHGFGGGSVSQSAAQRMREKDEDALQLKPRMQPVGEASSSVSADLEGEIRRARGGGKALAPELSETMGQLMGADLSGVRVHDDARSDQLSRLVSARAFTTGQDVFFRRGEYQPGSRGGQELLAHELTHVVQQESSRGASPAQASQEAGKRGVGGGSAVSRKTQRNQNGSRRAKEADQMWRVLNSITEKELPINPQDRENKKHKTIHSKTLPSVAAHEDRHEEMSASHGPRRLKSSISVGLQQQPNYRKAAASTNNLGYSLRKESTMIDTPSCQTLIVQKKQGDNHYGTVKTDNIYDKQKDKLFYEKHIVKLHHNDIFTLTGTTEYNDETIVKFIEGKVGPHGYPRAINIQIQEKYPNRKDPEHRGKYLGYVLPGVEKDKFEYVGKNEKYDPYRKYNSPSGRYDFIVLHSIHQKGVMISKKGHYSMGNDRSVYFAGEVYFSHGTVTKWNNKSGHYEPASIDAPVAPFPMSKYEDWQIGETQSKRETGQQQDEQEIAKMKAFLEVYLTNYDHEKNETWKALRRDVPMFKAMGWKRIRTFARNNKVRGSGNE